MFAIVLRLYEAFKNSKKGLIYAWKSQWAIRLEVLILITALPVAYYFAKNRIEYLLLISSILLLIIVEVLNTAIETTVNRISFERHELSGLAKDLGSAGVFLAGINIVFIWGIILFIH